MNISARLAQWKERGLLSPEQYLVLSGLSRGEPFSLSLELNILFYAGILAFVTGLGWTVTSFSQQLGDVLILAILSALLAACFWYCFSRAPKWSPMETAVPDLLFDYVLYLGSLIWSLELAYIERRFHLLSQQWDACLLLSAALFFFLAYRFDNRFVLSLALSALAGWFGFTISLWPSHQLATYRQYAVIYSLVVGGAGVTLYRLGLKPHFFGTFLNIAANVLFWAHLSGVFQPRGFLPWLFCLLIASGGSLVWGLKRRQFSFVAYSVVYGYVGVSSVLLRHANSINLTLAYFVFTGLAIIVTLVFMARRFAREA